MDLIKNHLQIYKKNNDKYLIWKTKHYIISKFTYITNKILIIHANEIFMFGKGDAIFDYRIEIKDEYLTLNIIKNYGIVYFNNFYVIEKNDLDSNILEEYFV